MSETGELPLPINPTTELARKGPLTTEEIAGIRTEKRGDGKIVKSYSTPDGTVTTTFISPNINEIPEDKREEIILFLSSRQDGESYRYEPLIVNALLSQFRIGQRFGLSKDSLYTDFKLDVREKGTNLVDDWGHLHLRVLDGHVNALKRQGATDEQLVTELTGHIFHESVHETEGNMREVLFDGRNSFGEITTVTAQMAFYLDEGYTGPTSYDINRFKVGFNKIRSGKTNSLDYDIATYVGVSLILQSLKEAYPAFLPEIEDMNPITACRTIVEKLSPEESQLLVPALKKAIARSADEKVFEDILQETKEEPQ